jgi:hypothetical protein
MTRKEARAICAEHNHTFRYDVAWREFRVCPYGGTEAQAYYTDDLEDAVETAKAVYRRSLTAH